MSEYLMDLLVNSSDSIFKKYAKSMAEVRGYDYERTKSNTGQDQLGNPIVMLSMIIFGFCFIATCCGYLFFLVLREVDRGEGNGVYYTKYDEFEQYDSN